MPSFQEMEVSLMAMIDIGSQKQLFADDYLIEGMTHTKQVMNPAEKVEDNPALGGG